MKLLSKINYTTKRKLGSAGRPIATATASAAALSYAGDKWAIELLDNNMAIVGISVLAAAAVEGTLYFFGSDVGEEMRDVVSVVDAVKTLTEDQYTAFLKVVEASVDKEHYDKVNAFLSAQRTVQPTTSKVRKVQQPQPTQQQTVQPTQQPVQTQTVQTQPTQQPVQSTISSNGTDLTYTVTVDNGNADPGNQRAV